MSTFSYHKPGIGNTSSYLVSGLPFITCSIAPPLDETSAVVNFPRVTNYVVVKNTSETNVGLRVSFNNDSIVDNTRYVLLSKGESFSGELRTTDVHLMSDGAAPVPFTVIAGLTNIERGEMTQTVPKPPNLLAWVEKQKLVASDPEYLGSFGTSLTLSYDKQKLVAGAMNFSSGTGSVYVFQNSDSGYQEIQKLTTSDADTDGSFGDEVSISSDGAIIAVSAWLEDPVGIANAGSVYIFQSGSTGYQQVEKLTASDAEVDDTFGRSISITHDGETLAVGTGIEDPAGIASAGSVYIFQSGSGGYQEVQKLTASDAAVGDFFGWSVTLSSTGETLAVGAYGDDENGANAGAVYIFESGSAGYQQVQKLTASFGTDGLPEVSPEGDNFGWSITLSATGETLAVGAYQDEENGGAQAGAVYIFASGSGGYQQIQKLTASFGTDGLPEVSPQGDWFGLSVTLSSNGETLAVGAYQDEENGSSAGAAYVFKKGIDGYQQVEKLIADTPQLYAAFGSSVFLSFDSDILFVGAQYENAEGVDYAGAVYVFRYTRDY